MMRPPIEPPGGKKKSSSNRTKPYCSRIGRQRHATCGGRKAKRTFDPSSGGIGEQVEHHQHEVDQHEVEQDQEDDGRDLGLELRVREEVANWQRGRDGQHEVRDRAGYRDDGLARSSALEVVRG